MAVDLLVVHPVDNVAVALRPLDPGAAIVHGTSVSLIVVQPIPFAHKVALRSIPVGAEIVKHGAAIGVATGAIEPGEHVHTHNILGIAAANRVAAPDERGERMETATR